MLSQVIKKDAINLLYKHVYSGLFISLVTSSILVFPFLNEENFNLRISWWLFFVILLFFRLGDLLYWQKYHLRQTFNVERAYQRFRFSIVLTALWWASFVLFFHKTSTLNELITTVIILTGMAAGGTSVFSAVKKIAFTYILILMIPYAYILLMSPDKQHNLLGVLGIFSAFTLIIMAKRLSDFTTEAIYVKNQHIDLLNTLEYKVNKRTEKILELSNIDALTGLKNRTSLVSSFNKLKDNYQQAAVLFIDLDGFKKINDTTNHQIGDNILKMVSERIKLALPTVASICRWGGDEFVIILPNITDISRLQALAQKLIDIVSQPYDFEELHLTLGATTGIALYPEQSDNIYQLIQLADIAMSEQKKTQKGQVVFYSTEIGKKVQRQLFLKDKLENAIDNNELYLVYQPIIAATNNSISALEALLRWQHDDQLIPPDEFIPIAETAGKIYAIGLWVLERACADGYQFYQLNPQIILQVNVSVQQFENVNFAQHVKNIIEHSQLPAQNLTLEITESLFISHSSTIQQNMDNLRRLGIKFAIDDFGTGYSSLSAIQDLAIDQIKIDKTFIDKIDTTGYAIINAVVSIASSLHYQVTAEGVETVEQVNALKALGVNRLQGYYFSKPVVNEQIINLLKTTN